MDLRNHLDIRDPIHPFPGMRLLSCPPAPHGKVGVGMNEVIVALIFIGCFLLLGNVFILIDRIRRWVKNEDHVPEPLRDHPNS